MTPGATTDPVDDSLPADWPRPDEAALTRQRALKTLIQRKIETGGGMIPFERYMHYALYAPGIGYYNAPQLKFGAEGDYVTAPTLSPLFAHCLARQLIDLLQPLASADVLEAGGGDGTLAAELLLALEALGCLPERYLILELSSFLRARQQATLTQRAPHLAGRVAWLDSLPRGFRGVVIGNEVLDAMPVARFRTTTDDVLEQGVMLRDGRLQLGELPAREAVRERVAALALAPDYVSEVGLQAEAWVRSLGESLDAGAILLIDYGFTRAEFYHPQRARGTLMCHYRHRAHNDALILTGLQDITAHVDFTAVAEAASEVGLDVRGYTSQAAFLIGCGLGELLVEPAGVRAQAERAHVVNQLTAPHEMGELFKVIALTRNLDVPLRGFALQDRRGRL
jgi:SAM-dependent MidA family methyltransferase